MAAPRKSAKTSNKDDFVKDVNGAELRLPSMANLKTGLLRKIRRLGDTDAIFTLLEILLPTESLDVLDEMTSEEFEELCAEWREHSGISLGE